LRALGHDDYANVANLIGYSYRKLGDYEQSQVWYERALKSDPNHVLTWQYYGLWQIEQGNRDQAMYHLQRIASICGTDCSEYRSLASALAQPPGTSLVYCRLAGGHLPIRENCKKGDVNGQVGIEVDGARACRGADRASHGRSGGRRRRSAVIAAGYQPPEGKEAEAVAA